MICVKRLGKNPTVFSVFQVESQIIVTYPKNGRTVWVEWAKACNFTNFPPVLAGPKNRLRGFKAQKSQYPKKYPT